MWCEAVRFGGCCPGLTGPDRQSRPFERSAVERVGLLQRHGACNGRRRMVPLQDERRLFQRLASLAPPSHGHSHRVLCTRSPRLSTHCHLSPARSATPAVHHLVTASLLKASSGLLFSCPTPALALFALRARDGQHRAHHFFDGVLFDVAAGSCTRSHRRRDEPEVG